jgi:hypothetical protein
MVGAEQADITVIAVVESDAAAAERLLGDFSSHALPTPRGVHNTSTSPTRRSDLRCTGRASKISPGAAVEGLAHMGGGA